MPEFNDEATITQIHLSIVDDNPDSSAVLPRSARPVTPGRARASEVAFELSMIPVDVTGEGPAIWPGRGG